MNNDDEKIIETFKNFDKDKYSLILSATSTDNEGVQNHKTYTKREKFTPWFWGCL